MSMYFWMKKKEKKIKKKTKNKNYMGSLANTLKKMKNSENS